MVHFLDVMRKISLYFSFFWSTCLLTKIPPPSAGGGHESQSNRSERTSWKTRPTSYDARLWCACCPFSRLHRYHKRANRHRNRHHLPATVVGHACYVG